MACVALCDAWLQVLETLPGRPFGSGEARVGAEISRV